MSGEDLTEKQKQFCQEFIIDFNATQAAIRAGYSPNVDSASVEGSRLLANAKIQAYLADLKAKRSKRTEITADKVLQELARIGFADIGEFIDENNNPVSIKGLKKSRRAAVAMVKFKKRIYYDKEGNPVEVESHEFSLHDKLSALDKIGRHIGMWDKETNNTTQPITIQFTGLEEMEKRIKEASNQSEVGQGSIETKNTGIQ